MKKPLTNLAASIHRRLLDGARARAEDFQLTLLRYGAERLLYRLGSSAHASAFILKGAMLFLLWKDQLYRPTRDIDLEGFGDASPERMRRIFCEVCDIACPEDALRFDAETVTALPIRTTQDDGGVRITMTVWLGKARISLQVDVGFGDVITPPASEATLPTLLPLDAPRLRAYPLETVVAEKFEALVRLGRANSRMKDFRDLAMLAGRCEFAGELLTRAVRATFAHRRTDMTLVAEVLTEDFYDDAALGQRWRAYLRTMPDAEHRSISLPDVGREMRRFLEPLAAAMAGGAQLLSWKHVEGWTLHRREGR